MEICFRENSRFFPSGLDSTWPTWLPDTAPSLRAGHVNSILGPEKPGIRSLGMVSLVWYGMSLPPHGPHLPGFPAAQHLENTHAIIESSPTRLRVLG